MVESIDQELEQERRREAVRAGRKGIGRKLQLMLEGVVQAPVPRSWLVLLEEADRTHADQPPDRARRTG